MITIFADIGGVPAVLQSTGKDHESGWGSGIWIFALVIIFFALVFFRDGFGGNRGSTGIAEIAALNAVNGGANGPNASAAFTELNGRLDGLAAQISHVNDVNDLRDLKSTQALLNQNVTQQAFNLSTQVATNRTDTLLNFKDLALQNAQCCCDTLRGQDQIRFEAQQNTCNIVSNNDANTQRILDRLCQDEVMRLRDELARERLVTSQFAQNAYLVDRLRPFPQPTYGVFPPVPMMEHAV